jgi:hypothetical protein
MANLIRKELDWEGLKESHICVKKASGRTIHTRLGLVGYCLKTLFAEKYGGASISDFDMFYKGLTEAELLEGIEQYRLYGNLDKDKKTVLTIGNILNRAENHWLFSMRTLSPPNIDRVIHHMIRTGRFSLEAGFARDGYGFNQLRLQAIWKCNTAPLECSLADVQNAIYPIKWGKDKVRYYTRNKVLGEEDEDEVAEKRARIDNNLYLQDNIEENVVSN